MPKHFCLPARVAALLVLHLVSAHSWSQTTQHTTEAAPPAPQKISDIIVIGNPLEARDVIAPVTSLAGANLLLKRASTLGETLSGEPGVSATWFGPNASRPVIRGLDGDRIRILNNQGASFDASSLSPDHAVALRTQERTRSSRTCSTPSATNAPSSQPLTGSDTSSRPTEKPAEWPGRPAR